jgi:hypothetical protein
VDDVSFNRCYGINDAAGTIDDQQTSESEWLRLNFSYCGVDPSGGGNGGDGVVIYSRVTGGDFTFTYCTVLKCIGATGIDFSTTTHRLTDHCNFYRNVFSSGSKTLFYSSTAYGLAVSHCIFNSNSDPIFALRVSGYTHGYIVSNCVFSADIAWNSVFSSTFNNQIMAEPVSHTLTYPWFTFCPTASPTQSPSETPFLSPTQRLTQSSSESRLSTEEFTYFQRITQVRRFFLHTVHFMVVVLGYQN